MKRFMSNIKCKTKMDRNTKEYQKKSLNKMKEFSKKNKTSKSKLKC